MRNSLHGWPSRTESSAVSEGESLQAPELRRFIAGHVFSLSMTKSQCAALASVESSCLGLPSAGTTGMFYHTETPSTYQL